MQLNMLCSDWHEALTHTVCVASKPCLALFLFQVTREGWQLVVIERSHLLLCIKYQSKFVKRNQLLTTQEWNGYLSQKCNGRDCWVKGYCLFLAWLTSFPCVTLFWCSSWSLVSRREWPWLWRASVLSQKW